MNVEQENRIKNVVETMEGIFNVVSDRLKLLNCRIVSCQLMRFSRIMKRASKTEVSVVDLASLSDVVEHLPVSRRAGRGQCRPESSSQILRCLTDEYLLI